MDPESKQAQLPLPAYRYNSPLVQIILIGAVCFCCPGMFNALSGMGGGGQVDHTAANNANTALYTTFAVFGVLGGGIYNLLGPRLTLLAGCLTYVLYAASFLYYNHHRHQLFAIVAGALLGVGAGLLWAAQGAIMTSYPPAKRKGTYISLFWSIFNMGGVIGGLIPFVLNYHRTTAASVNDGTYIAFMCFMFTGALLSLAILPPSQVVRDDGTRATTVKYSNVATESSEILKLFSNWKMLLLLPAAWASNFFYTYQFNNVNGLLFNVRTKGLNNVFYWGAQMVGSMGIGYLLDFSVESRRRRGFVGIVVVALMSSGIWAGGLANQLRFKHGDWPYGEIDFKDGRMFAGPFVLYFGYGLLDAMFQSLIYWVIGALADDSQILSRYLKYLGYEVKYVRNFTDIDDKIIKRANEAGENPLSLSNRFSNEFLKDMAELQCLPPTHEPRVSDHMDQIKNMITKIIDNNCGYVVEGDVYFSVDNFPDYCCLSRRKLDDNRAGGGGRVTIDTRKKNPADFALWKSAKPGEPSWESPWGPGRPGWHIECSAMSSHYLGPSFDIHGGGMDLIFPHHENEIAQSRAACPESKVNYWMHNGFVNKDNQKMSKSDNNFFTIRDIIASYHPLALRFFLMRTHYRSDVNYSDRQLDTASDRVFYMYQTLHDCEVAVAPFRDVINSKTQVSAEAQKLVKEFHEDFLGSMCDDLHTAIVLDKLENLLKAINGTLKKFKGKQQQQRLFKDLIAYEKEVKNVLGTLGLVSSSPCSEVLEQLRKLALKRAGITEEQVKEKIEERSSARKHKEYDKSDMIRKELYAKGIALMDEPQGTTWRPCEPPE